MLTWRAPETHIALVKASGSFPQLLSAESFTQVTRTTWSAVMNYVRAMSWLTNAACSHAHDCTTCVAFCRSLKYRAGIANSFGSPKI
jgi:hypothetical protein